MISRENLAYAGNTVWFGSDQASMDPSPLLSLQSNFVSKQEIRGHYPPHSLPFPALQILLSKQRPNVQHKGKVTKVVCI